MIIIIMEVFSGLIALISCAKWPIEKKGSKAAKKKRGTSNNECAKFSEQIALQGAMMIEMANRRYEANRLRDETDRDEINMLRDEVDMLRYEVDTLRDEATLREMKLQQLLNHVRSYKRCVPWIQKIFEAGKEECYDEKNA